MSLGHSTSPLSITVGDKSQHAREPKQPRQERIRDVYDDDSPTQPLLPRVSNAPDPSSRRKAAIGFLFMGLSACFQSLVTVLVHYAFTSTTLQYMRHDIPWQIWIRGFMGGLATVAAFSALALLPVGTAVTLFYLSPALTCIMDAVILRDTRLTLPLVATIMANFSGVVLVSQPSVSASAVSRDWWVGVACSLAMAFCSSSVYILQRSVGARVHFALSVFTYGIGCFVASLLFMLVTNQVASSFGQLVHNWKGTVCALCSGLAGFGSQSFLNLGLQRAPAGPSIVVRSLNVPFTFLLGFLLLGEQVGLVDVVGVLIVLASVAAIGYLQLIAKQQKKKLADA